MSEALRHLTRRRLLKGLLALPLLGLFERFRQILGLNKAQALASGALKVGKVSKLKDPWSSVAFQYPMKFKHKDVQGETIVEESIPGVVIRLPDELAAKRGGDLKAKFYVVNLHCTHQRCEAAYISDQKEVYSLTGQKVESPAIFCPCHRSLFDVATEGKPLGGPAEKPLWKFDFEINGDDIIVAGLPAEASRWNPGRSGGLSSEYRVRPGEPGL